MIPITREVSEFYVYSANIKIGEGFVRQYLCGGEKIGERTLPFALRGPHLSEHAVNRARSRLHAEFPDQFSASSHLRWLSNRPASL